LDGRRIEQVRAEPVAVDDETSRKALGTVAQAKRTADDSMANIQVAD